MDRKKVMYIGIILIFTVIISVTYFSYAFFTHTDEQRGKLNVVVGTLDYRIESDDLTNNQITLAAGEKKRINVKITSLNNTASKYELYYTTNNNDVSLGYDNSAEQPTGVINSNGAKSIILVVNNPSSSSATITFWVKGGFQNKSLTVSEGNSINKLTAKIMFNTNGGNTLDDSYYVIGDKFGVLPTPTKTNYTFKGWYADSSFNTPITTTSIVNQDGTIYAKWELNTYKAVRVLTTSTGGGDAAVRIYLGTFNFLNNTYTWTSNTNYIYNNSGNYNTYRTIGSDTIKIGYIQSDYKWYVYGLTSNVKRRNASGTVAANLGTSYVSWGYQTAIDYYFTSN